MATISVLDREMYSEAEAARYLRLPQSPCRPSGRLVASSDHSRGS